MSNKILDITIGGFFVLALLLGLSAQAADTGTVTATVTIENVSVTVSDGTVSYGTLTLSDNANTTAGDLNDTQSAVNNGNVTETLNIKGSTSTPGSWTLASSPDANTYQHQFSTSSGAAYVNMTVNYQTVTTTLATNATSTLDFQIYTPTSVSDYTLQNVDVTVQAVAT